MKLSIDPDALIDTSYREVAMSLARWCAQYAIPRHSLRLTVQRDCVIDAAVFQLVRYVAEMSGKDIVRVKYPADWWQAFKKRWAPRWFLRRWPVVYYRRQYVAKAWFPAVPLPEHLRAGMVIRFVVTDESVGR